MSTKEFEENIRALNSLNPEEVRSAVQELGYSEDMRAVPVLIEMLSKTDDINIKNSIAISLGDLGATEAVPVLIEFIKAPENKSRNGSFVYALQNLDCKEYFSDIVEMICTGGYEVYHHALDIFESLVDDATYGEKLLAKERLEAQEKIELAIPPSKHPEYDRIHFVKDALRLLD